MRSAPVTALTGAALLLITTTLFAGDFVVDGLIESGTGFRFPDGSTQTTAAGQYDKVIVVAKSGGHFTTIQAAINSATGAPGNRYLVYVAPGVYNERVTMKGGVDIQGAGALNTKITFAGSPADDTGTVIGATDAELRFLTVENTGGASTNAIAIYNNEASPRLTHVQAIALADGGTWAYGVYNRDSSPPMTYVFASASGATSNNYGVYNIDTAALLPTSPEMRQVVVLVGTLAPQGSDHYHGVFNTGGSGPVIRDSQISCLGGTRCYGVFSEVASVARLENVTVLASDATTSNTGVHSASNSDTVLRNCRVTGRKGIFGPSSVTYGLFNDMARPVVHHSILVGETNAMFGADPKVAYSQLVGPLATFTAGSCLGAYNENFGALGNDCK